MDTHSSVGAPQVLSQLLPPPRLMRSFREAILYETDGSLNLGWLFLLGLLLCIVGAIIVSAMGKSIPEAGWICLQVSFLAVLGASTTQNKAKIDATKPDKPAE